MAVLGPCPRQRVVGACPAAMARGVEPGLGRAGALALAPSLLLVDHDPGLLLATLKARLDDDAVCCLAVHSDHRPEQAWRHQAPLQSPPRIPADHPSTPAVAAGSARPISRPAPDTLLTGPARIESGWWDDEAADVCRDYFVARRADNSLVWVFRERRAPHGWFVHGYFA